MTATERPATQDAKHLKVLFSSFVLHVLLTSKFFAHG